METASLAGVADPDLLKRLKRSALSIQADCRIYAERHPAVAALIGRLDAALGQYGAEPGLGEVFGNFLAGTESSANALRWAMRMLAHHQDAQDALRAEACEGGERKLLQGFLNEVLRCFPPLPLTTRRATRDVEGPSLKARRGDILLLSIVGVHLDPEHWSEPRRFQPFRREFVSKTLNRRAFIPFTYGPRVCGGARLAQMELIEGLSALLRRYRFIEIGPGLPFSYAVSLRPILHNRLAIERL